ncbi:MAG TPA: fatty acid desaturase [Polyangia bacterium]
MGQALPGESAAELSLLDEGVRRSRRFPSPLTLWPPQPFVLVHLAALGVFFVDFAWHLPLIAVGSYYFRMFWVTMGYHRYFSHRAFKTSRAFQFVIAFMAMTSAQKGVLWWAAHHRDHHKYSDEPKDLHSPKQSGFWWAHIGWMLARGSGRTNHDRVRDFGDFPELQWLNRHWLVPPVAFFVVLALIGGLPLLLWGGVVGTILLWHATFSVNSLSHIIGIRRYQTSDDSRNCWWLALITCGEGWHNNHHHYQSTASQGWRWFELDVSYLGLLVLRSFRLVSDLRKPPPHVRTDLLIRT